MDIEKMTKKQFEALPYVVIKDYYNRFVEIDSIVLLPSKRLHDSGWRNYEIVPCLRREPLGKLHGYDTFSIYLTGIKEKVGVDCLGKSGLMRIFLPQDEYLIDCLYHEIIRKGDN